MLTDKLINVNCIMQTAKLCSYTMAFGTYLINTYKSRGSLKIVASASYRTLAELTFLHLNIVAVIRR